MHKKSWLRREMRKKVSHKLSNIKHAILKNNTHITCQDPCDSKLKGKSSRLSIIELKERLMLAKGSEYSLHSYKGVGGYAIFKHKCGLLINKKIHPFLNKDKVTPRSNKHLTDCPACAKSISPSIVNLEHWTSLVTNQQLALLDLKPTFLCRCGNEFQTGFEIILSQKHHGCAECYKKHHKKRDIFILISLEKLLVKEGLYCLHRYPKHTIVIFM